MGIPAVVPRYSSRIIKAGALLTDSRAFLRAYDPKLSAEENLAQALRRNILGKASRSRLKDILPMFRQRFLAPPSLAEALHELAHTDVSPPILDRILYYQAAKADGLLYKIVTDFVYKKREAGEVVVSPEDAGPGMGGASAGGA